MVARIVVLCSIAHRSTLFRWLGLAALGIILMLSVHPTASQDEEELPPHESAPPREAAVLTVTVSPRPELSADLGETATVPATVTNTGNIPALGVVVSVTDAGLLEGMPVSVGDLAPGAQTALELPVEVVGRSAFPLPFAVQATADNVEYPAIVTAEQTFAAPNSDLYLRGLNRVRVLLEHRRNRYDADNPVGRTLLWVEVTNPAIANRQVTIPLGRLLHGPVPADLTLRVLYYPPDINEPQELPLTYNPAGTRVELVLPGPGRYLVEWTRDAAAGEAAPLAAAATEPDLPQGWTPSYHAPLVSEFTGAVTLQYPIVTPPGAAGLQPNLGLSYSSANGNGMMGRLQADETGFGWTNNALIDVTQSLNTCHDNVCEGLGGDKDGNPSTYDPYNQYTLSFNGVGYELIHASGKAANGQPGRYYAQGNAGLYIELCKAPLSAYCNHLSDQNPMTYTVSNVVWRITGADGTTYRLGGTANSEQGLLQLEDAPDVRNKALRWRVDTVVDRFGNIMEYKYVEDNYTGWVHSEYFHAEASYVDEITYDTYKIDFIHNQLPYDVYRTQGYGYSVSYHTRYLGQIKVMNGAQQIRHYSLSQGFGRYGQDNDTDNLPLEPTLDATYGTQSPWCAAFEYVLDFKYEEPEDNVTYIPHKTPALLSIHEGGSDGLAKSSSPDTVFRYVFLGTGQYDHRDTDRRHLRYCFPYLDTVETIYGPAGVTPTTAYAWRDETSANPPTQSYGGILGASYLGRYVNTVERETTNSGFAADAPAMEKYYTYSTPNLQGNDDTFQGFVTVNRCEGAACSGTWERKTTVNFIAKPFYAADAALTGRMSQQDVRAYPDTLMARTEYTWGMLDADGVSGMDPSRVPVLTQQIQRDYRGADIGTRTGFVYDAFGNQTQTQEFGQTLSGGSPRRTLERLYNVNLDTAGDNWVVNLVERETLWDGPAGGADAKIVRRTNFRYDGVTCANTSTNPTLGQLTAQDQYLSGSAANCSTGSWLTTSYTYSATRKWQVTRITDPAGRFKTYTWTNATQLGSVAYAVDGINYTTSYTYDPVFRWQVRDVTQPNGATTRYLYDVHARLREVKQPNASTGAVGETSVTYTYNDTGNPFYAEEKSLAMDSVNPPTTRTFYDALGRPLQTRRWNVAGDDFTRAIIDTAYDNLGRLTCETPAMLDAGAVDSFNTALRCGNQSRTSYTYDVLDEQTSVTGINWATTTTTIDGRQRKITNGNGHMTTYTYDDLGRLVQVVEPAGGMTMTYTYTLAGDLLSAAGSNGVTTSMTYDLAGRKTGMNDPDMGVWSYGYDGAGNLTRQTDAKNQRLCFYYNAGGRLSSKTLSGTGTAACPSQPTGTTLATYGYAVSGKDKGMLSSISGLSGINAGGEEDGVSLTFSETFTYNYRGLVTGHTRTVDGRSFTLNTGYDTADRVNSMTYPGSPGQKVNVGYEGEYPENLATLNANNTVDKSLVLHLNYSQRGELTWLDRGLSGADTVYYYKGSGEGFRLNEIRHVNSGDGLPDFIFGDYDGLDNILEMTTRVTYNGVNGDETQTFTYDAVNRLATAKAVGGPAPYNYSYSYGIGGNISKRTNNNNGTNWTYAYGTPTDGAHALLSISGALTASFAYDNNGNMTARTIAGVAYTQKFDVENRLETVTVNGQTTRFVYDAEGNRILTLQHDGVKVYTPFAEYEETDDGGAVTKRSFYYLAGQLIASRVDGPSVNDDVYYYAYADHLGSIVAWSWTGGTPPVTGYLSRYEPFGGYRTRPDVAVNPAISSRGFTGHRGNNAGEQDIQNLNLIYMNARYYMPEIGRFISADTIVPDPANPQSYNRYAYVLNSPVNAIDPTGHAPTDGCDIAGCSSDPDTWQQNYDEYMATYHPDLVYGDWYSSQAYSGCFKCHAAVANGQVILKDQELAAAEVAMNVAAEQGLTAAAIGLTFGYGGARLLCADGDCTNEFGFAGVTTNRVFYSGVRPEAEAWAKANNSVTIGMTRTGRLLETITKPLGWNRVTHAVWKQASENFARGAAGEVHVFQSTFVNLNSIWVDEYRVLSSNPNVTRLLYHLVVDGTIVPPP